MGTRVEAVRASIVEAAFAEFADRGYHQTGIADIARRLGIGHGTFYRYFENKRDVASAVLDRALGRIAEVVAAEPPDATAGLEEYRAQVWRIGRRLYALFAADPALARLVFFDLATVDERLRERHREALDRFADYTAAYLRNGQDRGFLRADLDARVTARVVNGMVFEGAAQVARDPAAAALRDAWIRAVVTLMFDGLARPGPPS